MRVPLRRIGGESGELKPHNGIIDGDEASQSGDSESPQLGPPRQQDGQQGNRGEQGCGHGVQTGKPEGGQQGSRRQLPQHQAPGHPAGREVGRHGEIPAVSPGGTQPHGRAAGKREDQIFGTHGPPAQARRVPVRPVAQGQKGAWQEREPAVQSQPGERPAASQNQDCGNRREQRQIGEEVGVGGRHVGLNGRPPPGRTRTSGPPRGP